MRSYERGMVTLTRGRRRHRARAARTRTASRPSSSSTAWPRPPTSPASCPAFFDDLQAEAEATTRHGRLLRLEPRPLGREVIVHFGYWTADAHGMNMIVKATDRACRWLVEQGAGAAATTSSAAPSPRSGRAARCSPAARGRRSSPGARLPARARASLPPHHARAGSPTSGSSTVLGHLQAGALGYNGHYANGLDGALHRLRPGRGRTSSTPPSASPPSRSLPEGDLYASVTLPSLTVATVGGGTGLGTARECLEMLGCAGAGQAPEARRDRRRHPARRRALHGAAPSPAASSSRPTRPTAATGRLSRQDR